MKTNTPRVTTSKGSKETNTGRASSPKRQRTASASSSETQISKSLSTGRGISGNSQMDQTNNSNRQCTSSNNYPTVYNFLLTKYDSKFRTPKQVTQQLLKYLPRSTLSNVVFTRNGIILKSTDPDFAINVRNKVTYEIFGKDANIISLSQQAAKQPPAPRREPMLSVVIRGVPLDYSDDEVEEELRVEGHNIGKCLRIRTKEGGLSYMVRVLTNCKDTIDQLLSCGAYIYRCRYRVEPSRSPPPLPVRCERCQTYNQHNTNNCKDTPKCGHCSESHTTAKCTNLTEPPKCPTCSESHASYSYKCQAKPAAKLEHPELTVPLRTSDTPTPPNNSLRQPITIEDLLRFTTITLQNIHPFLRTHILQQITLAAKCLFKIQLQATYSGPHVHFSVQTIRNED
jgi:hypothetical protein